jgi:homoserine dehydrogenase
MKPLIIGLAGYGTVGRGVLNALLNNQHEITRRVGQPIAIQYIASRNTAQLKAELPASITVLDHVLDLAAQPDVDIIIELMGGDTDAKDLVLAAIAQGKHVVTANKKLLAMHGDVIFAAARTKQVMVAFEAAVAGGIPIIKTLREGLAANRIEWLAGIINGTSNFILSTMRETGAHFDTVLAQAQALGYAEADPRFDIEGQDAGHKLSILAAIAFGIPMPFAQCQLEGITQVQPLDIAYAETLGYRIKLLGFAGRTSQGLTLRVAPTLIHKNQLIANVEGVMNAVLVKSDMLGHSLYYGPGAGAAPTASAVIADLVDVARAASASPLHRVPHLAFQPEAIESLAATQALDNPATYYLRVRAKDKLGVLAAITSILTFHTVSIESLLQKNQIDTPSGLVDVVILTHQTNEAAMGDALVALNKLESITESVTAYRVANLN